MGVREECVLIDQTALNESIIPTTNVNRLLPDGTYEPNWKVINKKSYTEYLEDKFLHNKFINPHIRKNDNGQWEIDEANTNFNDLPEILKQEKVYEEDLDNTCSIIGIYIASKEQQLARICQNWDEKEEDYIDKNAERYLCELEKMNNIKKN